MREIIFRAKSIDGGDEFYYGDFMHDGGESCCLYFREDGSDAAMNPDTVGQFTGMYDCNGEEIYEGDLVKAKNHDGVAEFVFKQGCWCLDNCHLNLIDERFCLYD